VNAQDSLLLKSAFFTFLYVQWLYFTREIDEFAAFLYGIFSGWRIPKLIKISIFGLSYLKIKRLAFSDHSVQLIWQLVWETPSLKNAVLCLSQYVLHGISLVGYFFWLAPVR